MPNPKLSSRIKIAFLNIMQAMGAAASHLASNAKLRVNEINLESRRHEILTEFSLQAFEMWHNGVKLPKELSDMFTELSEIDDKLSILRAQKFAKVNEDGVETTPKNDKEVNTAETGAKVLEAKPNTQAPLSNPASPAEKTAGPSTVIKPTAKAESKPAAKQPVPDARSKPAAKKAVSSASKKPRTTIHKAEKATQPKEHE